MTYTILGMSFQTYSEKIRWKEKVWQKEGTFLLVSAHKPYGEADLIFKQEIRVNTRFNDQNCTLI